MHILCVRLDCILELGFTIGIRASTEDLEDYTINNLEDYWNFSKNLKNFRSFCTDSTVHQRIFAIWRMLWSLIDQKVISIQFWIDNLSKFQINLVNFEVFKCFGRTSLFIVFLIDFVEFLKFWSKFCYKNIRNVVCGRFVVVIWRKYKELEEFGRKSWKIYRARKEAMRFSLCDIIHATSFLRDSCAIS